MAFVWKSPKSKYWIARFYDLTGKRRNRSTKTINRRQAEKLAEQFEAAAQKKRTARQARKVIADLHREITGENLISVTVRDFTTQWLATKKAEVKDTTWDFYSGATSRFVDWLEALADGDLGDITRDQIIAFRNAEALRTASKTANHKLKALRMIFKSAKRDGLIAEDPTEFVETVRKTGSKGRRAFTLDEIRAVLDQSDDEWKSMILVAFYTGQRLGDIAALSWSNIDLEKGQIRLTTQKTGRGMILPIAPPLQLHLEKLAGSDSPDAPLHPRAFAVVERNGRSAALSNHFAGILASAGLRPKTSHKKKNESGPRLHHSLSFHSLRATATTLLHEAGVPAAVAQTLIGHDSEEVHKIYVKVGSEALREAAGKLPDL